MISLETIDKTILEHESKDTTYANCEKLAWLYIVRDHLREYEPHSNSQLMDINSKETNSIKQLNGGSNSTVYLYQYFFLNTINLLII